MVKVLVLGSKEYPFGTNKGDDPIPSGGMETYVDDLAPELSKLCELVIMTRKFRGTKKLEKKGNITVCRVPWLKGKWLRNPSFNFASFVSSIGFMKDVDIIYSNGIISGLVALKLGKLFGKKTVYRPAGIGFLQYRFPLKQALFALERFVLKRSSVVIFHSEGEKKNAQNHFGLKLRHGHAILTGFPVDKFSRKGSGLKKSMGIGNETVITTIARFVPVKGLDYMLKACSRLKGKFKILMVGSGPEEEMLVKLVRGMGMEKDVIFTGFRHDIPDILGMTDIYVISSFSEGLPTSLLEAMAAGNACVVTDIGLPVDHMKTGLVVMPRNMQALRNDIQSLVDDPALRKKLGENAVKFVSENCTQKMAARKHMDIFSKLVGR